MQAVLQIQGHDLVLRSSYGGDTGRLALDDDRMAAIDDWRGRYAMAVHGDDLDALAGIGVEMFRWLDSEGWASLWLDRPGDERGLAIQCDSAADPIAATVLDLPWEILAHPKTGMVADDTRLFLVHRRIGVAGEAPPAGHGDFAVLFMAAAPEGAQELDYEAEEAAILAATATLPLRLAVEESGRVGALDQSAGAGRPVRRAASVLPRQYRRYARPLSGVGKRGRRHRPGHRREPAARARREQTAVGVSVGLPDGGDAGEWRRRSVRPRSRGKRRRQCAGLGWFGLRPRCAAVCRKLLSRTGARPVDCLCGRHGGGPI